MNLRYILVILGLHFVGPLWATHIVGGGFSYSHISGDDYKFRLQIYFDDINGNPGAIDQIATCFIFAKGGLNPEATIEMPLTEFSDFVPYTNPPCANTSGVRTKILIYETNVTLSQQVYDNPNGYYIIWERCCRNGVITNINEPGATGQVFFMEFPPVVIGSQPFMNNSPVFKPIKADYPCLGEQFSLAFGAEDSDGDSLIYSLVVPLKGNTTNQDPINPPPSPEPYSLVQWSPGFGLNNSIPGTPPLRVNPKTGILTCTPTLSGLFVFSVKCEEYRNNRKIGEVRREMQMLVKECVPNTPPIITIRNPLTGLALAENDTFFFDVTNKRVCNFVTAKDAQLDQSIRFQVKTLASNVPGTLIRDTTVFFQSGVDSLVIPFCLEPCLQTPQDVAWKVQFFASDNGCSFSKSDSLTLFIVARIRLDSIKKPQIVSLLSLTDTFLIEQTEVLSLPFRAFQSQDAILSVRSTLEDSSGAAIPLQSNGILLPSGNGIGLVNTRFLWPEICFVPEKQPLKLIIIVDGDYCLQRTSDTLIRYLRIAQKGLEVGVQAGNPIGPFLEMRVGEEIKIPVIGTVTDNRLVQLASAGTLKSLPKFSFPESSGNGLTRSEFQFGTDCSTPAGLYRVQFNATSQYCNVNYIDSLAYSIQVIPDIDTLGIIPNLLTSNGDGKNDYLSLEKILPFDNCFFNFDFVEIYNRWGKPVFNSSNRNFKWQPEADKDGIYFYALHFKEKSFTSWLAVVR